MTTDRLLQRQIRIHSSKSKIYTFVFSAPASLREFLLFLRLECMTGYTTSLNINTAKIIHTLFYIKCPRIQSVIQQPLSFAEINQLNQLKNILQTILLELS